MTHPEAVPVAIRFEPPLQKEIIMYDNKSHSLNFTPSLVKTIGTYNYSVILTDYHKENKTYEFIFWVRSPPFFSRPLNKIFAVRIGQIQQLTLQMTEPDNFNMTHSEIPSVFTKTQNVTYTFHPKVQNHLGKFKVKGRITNKWGFLDFEFNVLVFNDPPMLQPPPQDLDVVQESPTVSYTLPEPKDPEAHTFTIRTYEFNKQALPSFMVY